MRNNDLREMAEKHKIRLWQIAEVYGINDGNFSRLLRKELSPEVKERLFNIIDELARKEGE